MKKSSKTLLVLLGSLALVSLAACQKGASGPAMASEIFANKKAYFDTTDPQTISVDMGVELKVSSVAIGRTAAESGQFGSSGSILTLSGDYLKSITAGEKEVKVISGEDTLKLDLFAANKVIKTADDFQNIQNNLTGYYILGNDIDLSSIENFEPLGVYYTETDTRNAYFHGVLEGNGYTVKNAKVYWSDTVASNYNVYQGSGTHFTSDAHVNGDNIGLFAIIGSSGVVRNTNFANIKVRGRTIVGALAGNCMGTVENCYLDSSCSVEMGTHFYDDDCNMGGAFGIVAGSGNVNNVISQVTNLTEGCTSVQSFGGISTDNAGVYLDWDDVYKGKTGNGWDHGTPATNDNSWWKFCAVDKVATGSTTAYKDSNGSPTNGEYAFVGKCWGSVANCVAQSFKITPMNGTMRDIFFGQTHLAANKPTSGDTDLGTLTNDQILSLSDMKKASSYSAFDSSVWTIADGKIPTLNKTYVVTANAAK